MFTIAQLAGAVEYSTFLQRGKNPPLPPNDYCGYETKQSDGEASVILELWGMRSTPSLPSLPDPLWPGVVPSDRNKLYTYMKLNCLK